MTTFTADPLSDVLQNEARGLHAVVVALHSSASNSRQWGAWKKALAPTIEFVAPDLLGYGSDGSWSTGHRVTLADEVFAISRHFLHREQPVHLVGHSYGGAVALEVALRYPERVQSVTLYEPVRFGLLRAFEEPTWLDILEIGQRVAELVESGQQSLAAALFVDYWSGTGTWDRLSLEKQRPLAELTPKVSADFGALFGDEVPPEAYRQIRVPVRLMHGTTSPEPVLRIAERLARLLPNVDCRRLDGLGHMAPLQAADRVLAASGLERLR